MNPSVPPSVSSPSSQEPERCRVTKWAKAWAEYFRHSIEEQQLAETFAKDDFNKPPRATEECKE